MNAIPKFRLASVESESRWNHFGGLPACAEVEWLGCIPSPFNESSFRHIDGLIVSDEYALKCRLALLACRALRKPTFHIMDGIVEWRNTFENPRSTNLEQGAPLFQPLIADKTFCIGRCHEQVLRWLGNDCVYPTGLPRLDSLFQSASPFQMASHSERPSDPARPRQLLIATANTPWFDDIQRQQFLAEFQPLASLLNGSHGSRPTWTCTWRVAADVAAICGLPAAGRESLSDVLRRVDAVICTPSTLVVEAMAAGCPTLVFDPWCCPPWLPSAWYANSAAGVQQLLPSLLQPCHNRLRWQQSLLSSITPVDGRAGERVCEIVLQSLNSRRAGYSSATVDQSAASRTLAEPMDESRQSLVPDAVPAEVLAAYRTLPSLQRRLGDQQRELQRLHTQIAQPSLRQGMGALWRAFTSRRSPDHVSQQPR